MIFKVYINLYSCDIEEIEEKGRELDFDNKYDIKDFVKMAYNEGEIYIQGFEDVFVI